MLNYKLTSDIKEFYHNNLKKMKHSSAEDFLNKKFITEEAINDFNVGIAVNGNDLSKYLVSKGYSKEEILNTKLVVDDNNKLVDVIKDKIVVPIEDEKDRCVAFTSIDYNDINYYEETYQYDDSKSVIFNYKRCKQNKDSKMFYGSKLEVLELYSFGVKVAFSTKDSIMTDEEVKLIKKITNRVAIELKKKDKLSSYVTYYNTNKLLENDVRVIITPTYT